MSDVTIYHNPHCHASQNAITIADELGVDYDVVLYLKERPDRVTLESIADRLEDPVADLVRKDSLFKKLGLDEADYVERGPVVELLERSARRCSSGPSSCAATGRSWAARRSASATC